MKNACFTGKYGREILILNFENESREDILALIAECARLVRSRPLKSVRCLIVVRKCFFDSEVIEALKSMVCGNAAHIARTAVVGATGIYRGVVDAIARVNGCAFELCANEEEAIAYLLDAR